MKRNDGSGSKRPSLLDFTPKKEATFDPAVVRRARRLHAAQLMIGSLREEGVTLVIHDGEVKQRGWNSDSPVYAKAYRELKAELKEVLLAEGYRDDGMEVVRYLS